MDLLDLTPKSEELVVALKHPATGDVLKNEDGSDMTITVFAPYSKEYKKVLHEMTNKRLKKLQGKGAKEITAEELDEISLDSLAKTTKEWNITFSGEKPKLSLAKAREVYERVFWIKAQIEEASEEALGFMKA